MIDEKSVGRLYEQGKSQNELARMFGSHQSTIYRILKKLKIPARKNGWVGNGGPKHPQWKNGVTTTTQGYIHVYCPNHPRANVRNAVPLQVLVMEEHLGRYLKWIRKCHPENEVVHHKNLDKTDNRLENLQLMTVREHSQLHAPKSRFTREQRDEIRREWRDEMGCKHGSKHLLAVKYGVTDSCMGDLLRSEMKIDKS